MIVRSIKRVVRRAASSEAYRNHRGRRQQASYESLLRTVDTGGAVYSEAVTRQRLAAKASARRTLCNAGGRPTVVGFGFEDWEQYGLWPSFGRRSTFSFQNMGTMSRQLGITRCNEAARQALAKACLAHLDAVGREQPVSLAFFYIDTESLTRGLFEGLAERGIWSVLMGLDDQHRFQPRRERGMLVGQATLAPHADLLWTTWRTGAQLIQNIGGTAWYAGEGADPAFHRAASVERDIDVLFLGQYHGGRGRLIEYLRARGLNIHAAGVGWPDGRMAFEKTVALMNRARVVLGYGMAGCMPGVQHLKGRDFEAPMCGAAYVTSYNPELADQYVIGEEIMCYSSPLNCAELLHWLLKNPQKLAALRAAGQRRALRDHTWEGRITALFELFPA